MAEAPAAREFLYLLRPARLEMLTAGPTAAEAAIVSEHFAYLQALTEQGVMILVGRTLNNDAETLGLAIFRAGSEAEARAIMENDPAVRAGVMTAKLYPYRIALLAAPPVPAAHS